MPVNVSPTEFAKINAELSDGRCVALPTETVYGLAADATNGEAVARIFDMKNRPSFNPLICHVCDIEMANRYGKFNKLALNLAEAFWPGPLTLILPIKAEGAVHPLVSAELGTVGLRAPMGIANDIIRKYGKPLAAPSANRSGRISPTTAEHVSEEFSDRDLMIINGPPCEIGIESTIVKIIADEIILLRPGAITEEMIFDAVNITPQINQSNEIQAPGMMRSHYAPNAKLLLNQTDIPEGANVLAFGGAQNIKKPRRLFNLSGTKNLLEAAANLYKGMKLLDAMDVDVIHVEPIPLLGLGIAINDRLSRAAAPKEETL